ncbi:hypothetical protein Tco_1230740 [Tanacetum coccineum]
MQLKELMDIVPKLVTRIETLEIELQQTKITYGKAVLTLVKRGRIIQDIDDDPLVSLVRESMKEKPTDFVTPTKALGEAQEEDISPIILEEAKTLSKVASQGVNKEKSTDKGKGYRKRARSVVKNINIGLDIEEEVNTGSTKVDSGTTSKRGQKEGKAPMVEEEIQDTHKTKEQMRQEEAGLEEAIKLLAQLDEEVAKQIHLDKMIAKRMAEDEALTKQQKKRKAQDLPEQDFVKRMVDMVNQRKKHFAEERAKKKRNKPMTESQLRIYMSNYLKNQGTWKLSQLKKLKFEEIKEEFDKFDDKDVPAIEDKVAEVKEEEPVKTEQEKERSKRLEKGVLWSDLRDYVCITLNEDAIWSLPLQQKMIGNILCQKMLKMKLLDGKMNEVCYKLLKMIEKQAGIRK